MKDEEIIELEVLRAEVVRYHREMHAATQECVRLMQGPASRASRERAQRIQGEIEQREARFQRVAGLVMDLLARPVDDARLAAEGLPS